MSDANIIKSSRDLVSGQTLQATGISSPVDGRIGGDAAIVVKVYAFGRGVSIKRQGCNLLAREGAFELEANGKIFVFDPLGAGQANGLVTPVQGDVTATLLSLQAVDQEHLAEFGNGFGHGGVSLKTTILALPQGCGKTSMARALADKLGCTGVIDEWNPKTALTPDALHLTNDVSAVCGAIDLVSAP